MSGLAPGILSPFETLPGRRSSRRWVVRRLLFAQTRQALGEHEACPAPQDDRPARMASLPGSWISRSKANPC